MNDSVKAALEGRRDDVRVNKIALDDLDCRIGMGLQVDDPHMRAVGSQLSDHVPADEAGTSGDENAPPAEGPRRGRAHVCASALAV
jgi:hypothetical protein